MIMTRTNPIASIFIALPFLALGACDRAPPETAETSQPTSGPVKPVSIFRPEAEVVPVEAPLAPLDASVSFAQGGRELGEAAKSQLAIILQSPQMKAGGIITLRGHTDTVGYDEANLRVSRQRAEAVEEYLVDKGVAPDRIEVIALGEMRPIAPNAKLDGTPDEEGRAANRRVDVTIAVPGAPTGDQEPAGKKPQARAGSTTLVEAITKPD